MIDPDLFLAFLLATAVLILMPGPIVTLVIAQSLTHGRRTGLLTVAGSSLGNAVLVAIGALGLTTLLAVLADVFEWIRWGGVAWLIWLGLRRWRLALGPADEDAIDLPQGNSVFWQGFLVAITNPKTILFYAAFFPQFLDTGLPAGPQLALMSLAFIVIGVVFDGSYALLSSRVRPWFLGRRRAAVRNGIAGTLLIGTGLGLALVRRS